MNLALQLDDNAYAVAKAYADEQRCSMSDAVSKLVLKSGFVVRETTPRKGGEIRFPLVRGRKPITPEDVDRLQDED
jgi:hypothetical protein